MTPSIEHAVFNIVDVDGAARERKGEAFAIAFEGCVYRRLVIPLEKRHGGIQVLGGFPGDGRSVYSDEQIARLHAGVHGRRIAEYAHDHQVSLAVQAHEHAHAAVLTGGFLVHGLVFFGRVVEGIGIFQRGEHAANGAGGKLFFVNLGIVIALDNFENFPGARQRVVAVGRVRGSGAGQQQRQRRRSHGYNQHQADHCQPRYGAFEHTRSSCCRRSSLSAAAMRLCARVRIAGGRVSLAAGAFPCEHMRPRAGRMLRVCFGAAGNFCPAASSF